MGIKLAILLLCFFSSQAFIGSSAAEPEVKLLHVLFRHGDKVPHKEYQNYPNDPWGNHSYFPVENGGLTNEGKRREYKIGEMLRERYDKFFGPHYTPELIYGQSTDLSRTQMSLQLVLAGLFPPAQEQTWNPRLPWLPVFTTFTPSERDGLLFPHHCPEYSKEYKNFLSQDHIQEMIRKYKEPMDYLSVHTGKTVDRTSAVYYLYNLFKEQAAQNLSLPHWVHKVYPNPMKEITALDFHLRSYTRRLRRLNGGPLLRKITESMRALSSERLDPPTRKAFFYSAHELNVVSMARTLGTDDPVIPLYGSAIIFETLQDERKRFYVKVLLWTGITEHLVSQRIPGCPELCPLDDFLDILREVIPNEKEGNCWSHHDNENQKHRRLSEGSASHRVFAEYSTLVTLVILSFMFH
ncbi:venom acid phosphatase Acph-1 [Diachasma alloeum]|uniref:venom acid phosphatase Acph-1 n=1 Tax=Diachasma alloeum TaxID=454923 RepID=UPI0007384C74|nr:venom acid phosphatase Acph-1 [Diachasma alloeum]